MTQRQYEKILKSDDIQKKRETMLMIKKRKLDWNRRLIALTRQEINEIVAFQKALHKVMPESELETEYRQRIK